MELEEYCLFDSGITDIVEVGTDLLVMCADGTSYLIDDEGQKTEITIH